MFSDLKKMCLPPGPGKAYYRPFLCKGNQEKLPIFLVGINPATPIFPEQKNIDEYMNLIKNYDVFMEFYMSKRKEAGKTPLSKTRKSIKEFVEWLHSQTGVSIAETNIVSYPTESLALLKKEPESVLNRGKKIFYELMMYYKPSILIVHGKSTVKMLTDLLIDMRLITDAKGNDIINTLLKMDYSMNSPIAEFNFLEGQSCSIIAYQHFIYYGSHGKNSSRFRERVAELINERGLLIE